MPLAWCTSTPTTSACISYPGPRRFDEFTALLNHVTRALSRYGLGKLLIDQRQMTPYVADEQVHLVQQ